MQPFVHIVLKRIYCSHTLYQTPVSWCCNPRDTQHPCIQGPSLSTLVIMVNSWACYLIAAYGRLIARLGYIKTWLHVQTRSDDLSHTIFQLKTKACVVCLSLTGQKCFQFLRDPQWIIESTEKNKLLNLSQHLSYNVCWSGWVLDLAVLEMHCFQVNPFALNWYFASVNTKSSAQEDTGCGGHRCSQSFLIAIYVFFALKRLQWTVHVIKCCCISAMIVITDVFRMDHIPLALTVWSPVVWPSLF